MTRSFCPATLSFLCLFSIGCATNTSPTLPIAGAQLRGNIHGGQQPVSGASIQLYAAGNTGYGAGATPLLTNPVTSDSNGAFSITGDYTCPSSTSQLYIVATGGNPGLPPGTNNPSLALAAALGPCSLYSGRYTLNPNSTINMNEVTTVAAVYALSGFLSSDATQIGTSGANAAGLANAFQTVKNLVDISTGQALTTTPAGNGIVPQAKINTLANLIAPCINSNGIDSACSSLFTAATPAGGSVPTNTLQALLNIAQQPSSQVAALYALVPAFAPFQPALSATPNDWTLRIRYTVPTAFYIAGTAIDASGNIWIVGYSNVTGPPSVLTELSNTGAVLSGPNGYSVGTTATAGGPSIDPAGNIWVTSSQPAGVVKLSSDGTILSGSSGYTIAAMTSPRSVAIDGAGNAWVTNNGASPNIFKLANDGTNLSGASGFGSAGLANPGNIAIDAPGNAWISSANDPIVAEFNSAGSLLSGAGFTGGGLLGLSLAGTVAIDSTGSVWVTNSSGGSSTAQLAKFSSAGAALSGATGFATCLFAQVSPYNCYGSTGLAIDGSGNAWNPAIYQYSFHGVTQTAVGITRVSNDGTLLSGPKGYNADNSDSVAFLQVDSSGNIWGAGGPIIELIGAATPAVTPLSIAARDNKLGTRP